MTKIRLARAGSIHKPFYHIVVTDSRNRRDGRFIEKLGYYDPIHHASELNQERVTYWISVGAQPSNTTISLLTRAGVKHPFTVRRKPTRTKPVEEVPAKAEVAEEPVAPEAVDAGDEVVEAEPLSDAAAEAEAEVPAEDAVETNDQV